MIRLLDKINYRAVILTIVSVAFFLTLAIFCYRAYTGLSLFLFGDEIDKLVAAQLIHVGMHLYKDIFSHHGPLLYIFSHAYVVLVSSTDFTAIRSIVAVFALSLTFFVATSPILKSGIAKVWAAVMLLAMLSSIWWVQGIHMLLYHGMGGIFLTIVLVQLVIPLLIGAKIRRIHIITAGSSAALGIACAYTFSLSIFFMLIAALLCVVNDKHKVRLSELIFFGMLGFVPIILLVAIWLAVFGDLKGYWVYHIYFNQVVYLKFVTFSIFDAINSLVVSTDPKEIIGSIATVILAFSVIIILRFLRVSLIRLIAVIALIISILLMNPRGAAIFQNGGYIIASLSLFSLCVAYCIDQNIGKQQLKSVWLGIALSTVCILLVEIISRQAISSPTETQRKDFHSKIIELKPSNDEKYQYIRELVKPNERLQALLINSEEYIFADRLPATGNFYYLPWQAYYNKNPLPGYKLDLCQQLAETMPPVIIFDNLKIWGVLAIEDYEPCIIQFLNDHYIRLSSQTNFYVRPDRVNN